MDQQSLSPSSCRYPLNQPVCQGSGRAAELEFLEAIQEYKRSSGRMFPTWSEVLEVIQGLGYAKAK